MSGAKKASYLLFAVFFASLIALKLGPALLAGLFAFMIIDLTHRLLTGRVPELLARWISVLLFALIATGLVWMLILFVKLALVRLPVLLSSVLPTVDALAATWGLELPFENLRELRELMLDALRDNASSITQTSGLLTKGVFQVIVGIFISILAFLSLGDKPAAPRPNLYDEFRRESTERVKTFMRGFEKVFGAQVMISGINTVITAVFLLAIGIPFVHFLVLSTFILGTLPLVGNILSNTIIVGTALTLSPRHAAFALIFLVLIHKAEYFLNGRIVGGSINTPMWMTLLGILVGEVVMGVPGILLAPTIIHYAREELQAIPARG